MGASSTKSLLVGVLLALIMAPPLPANAGKGFFPPAPPSNGKSHFFASPRACASSGQFSQQDCAVAFERVAALIRERAPKFANKYECVLQFKLCEADEAGFTPATLGVEISRSPQGLTALPMLAVETPRDMLRDSEPPRAPSGAAVEAALQTGSRAPSPYGVLALDAVHPAPPSLKSYHKHIEEALLGSPVDSQRVVANSSGRAGQ